jgi:hypothetical protein
MSQENPTTPAQPTPAVATPQTVTIPLEQLQAFTSIQARLAEHEERVRREAQEAQRREAEVLAERGNLQDALRQLREQSEQQLIAERQKHAEVQQRAQQYALDSELSRSLAGENLVPGGVEQLTRLFRGEFVVEPQGHAFHVRTPAFQSVPDFIKAQLGRPEFAHFLRAQNPGGGTAAGQPVQAAPTPPANPSMAPQPRNMGEAVILHMQGVQKAQGDSRANMNLPMGLRAAAR